MPSPDYSGTAGLCANLPRLETTPTGIPGHHRRPDPQRPADLQQPDEKTGRPKPEVAVRASEDAGLVAAQRLP